MERNFVYINFASMVMMFIVSILKVFNEGINNITMMMIPTWCILFVLMAMLREMRRNGELQAKATDVMSKKNVNNNAKNHVEALPPNVAESPTETQLTQNPGPNPDNTPDSCNRFIGAQVSSDSHSLPAQVDFPEGDILTEQPEPIKIVNAISETKLPTVPGPVQELEEPEIVDGGTGVISANLLRDPISNNTKGVQTAFGPPSPHPQNRKQPILLPRELITGLSPSSRRKNPPTSEEGDLVQTADLSKHSTANKSTLDSTDFKIFSNANLHEEHDDGDDIPSRQLTGNSEIVHPTGASCFTKDQVLMLHQTTKVSQLQPHDAHQNVVMQRVETVSRACDEPASEGDSASAEDTPMSESVHTPGEGASQDGASTSDVHQDECQATADYNNTNIYLALSSKVESPENEMFQADMVLHLQPHDAQQGQAMQRVETVSSADDSENHSPWTEDAPRSVGVLTTTDRAPQDETSTSDVHQDEYQAAADYNNTEIYLAPRTRIEPPQNQKEKQLDFMVIRNLKKKLKYKIWIETDKRSYKNLGWTKDFITEAFYDKLTEYEEIMLQALRNPLPVQNEICNLWAVGFGQTVMSDCQICQTRPIDSTCVGCGVRICDRLECVRHGGCRDRRDKAF